VKVFRQGFYWPSVIDDASKLVTTCQACQNFLPNTQAPSQPLQLITPSWPLQRWGINIVGLRRYFWQNIICHFGVPRKIIVDNAKQFNCYIFKDFCHQMGIKAAFTSVYHRKSKHTNIYSRKKDIRKPAKGQVGRGIAESSMESEHLRL
jgi:hypothetical protein